MRIEYKDSKKNNWFLITWDLSNKCNYRCNYCPSMFHDGSSGWPDIVKVKEFIKKINKLLPNKDICFRISGGEPTYWKHFLEFAKGVKEYNNSFTFLTNASRDILYFKEINPFVDGLILSYHLQYSNIDNFCKIIDIMECPVAINLMMIPTEFDQLLNIAERLYNNGAAVWPKILLDKTSDIDIITNNTIEYSLEQKQIIQEWKYFRKIDDSKIHRGKLLLDDVEITANDLILSGKNSHKGWQCWAGLDMINIDFWGNIYRANCEQGGNLGNIENFKLPIDTLICNKELCACLSDIYLRKSKPLL